jgi:hypothetical protein
MNIFEKEKTIVAEIMKNISSKSVFGGCGMEIELGFI